MAVAPFPELQDRITDLLGRMCSASAQMLRDATAALRDDRDRLAVRVEAGDAEIDALRDEIERLVVTVLTAHKPVAGDLRTMVAAIRCSGDIERMGDLAAHIARTVIRGGASSIPPEVVEIFVEMGRRGAAMADKTAEVARTHNVVLALELPEDDGAPDRLLREVFELLLAPEWSHGVCTAVDVTLLARYYERFADHSVKVAEQIVYAVTGRASDEVAAALEE